jgi:hypothetical protein
LELDGNPIGGAVYRGFLDRAGIPRLRLDPDDGSVHAFEVPLEEGAALVLYNEASARRKVSVEGSALATRIEAELDGRRTGFVLANAGKVLAAEAQGMVTVDGRAILLAEGHQAVMALDGADLDASRAWLVLPFGPGGVLLGDAGDAAAAVETGEFRAGRWQTLATETPAAGAIPVNIDAGAPFDLRLVTAPDGLAAVRRAVERLLSGKP